MTSKKRVLIATPSYDGKLDIYYIDSLLNTLAQSEQHGIEVYPLFMCYDSLVQRARNDLFKAAHDADIDALFFIDGDIGWDAENFFKLVNSNKDIIGGSYRKKNDNEELYVVKALDSKDKSLDLTIDNEGLMEVAGLGCGFMKISKKAINTLWNVSKQYNCEKGDNRMVFEVVCEDNDLISEDIYMCKKWRDLGNKVYLDTNITCTHTGTKTFTGNVYAWLQKFITQKSNTPTNTINEDLSSYFKNSTPLGDDDFKVLV
jgi:hypothetical protein